MSTPTAAPATPSATAPTVAATTLAAPTAPTAQQTTDQENRDRDARTAQEQSRNAGGDMMSQIFMMLFNSIFSSLFGVSPEQLNNPDDAPDFEGVTDPAERARLEQDYTRNRESRERAGGDYSSSTGNWTADSIAQSSQTLIALRAKWEGIRGGHVDATSPVDNGRINSEFGHREASATGGVGSTEHKGLDIGPPERGEKVAVKAPMPGVVIGKGWRGGYGNMLEIVDIYGMHHRFGHLDSINVKIGDTVEPGQAMAVMGTTGHSTGVHLHYEQRLGYDSSHPQGIAIAATIDGKNNWQQGQRLASAATPQTAKSPVQVAANAPAAAPAQAHPKTTAHPAAKAPAHEPSILQQVASLHLPKFDVADAVQGTKTAFANGISAIGSVLRG